MFSVSEFQKLRYPAPIASDAEQYSAMAMPKSGARKHWGYSAASHQRKETFTH
jgi:hypothetical protein